MSKGRVITKTIKDGQLVEMFNQMLGDGDPEIISSKLATLKARAETITKITNGFATGPFSRDFPEYKSWCDEFLQFSEKMKQLLELEYSEFKVHNQTKQLILICRALIDHVHFLSDLNDKWITSQPGLQYSPFSFTALDFKSIWYNTAVTPAIKKYILTTMSMLFNYCHEIYKIITSPDIDVKKFSQIIIDSIDKIKSMPELSRCNEAFNKIKESVSLLENNFEGYYKDMMQSENPSTLIENFIVDVSKGQNMNLSLMQQFRKIIAFYKKQGGNKISDPSIKKLINTMEQRMDSAEKNLQK